MSTSARSLWKDLLFLHGHIVDPQLASSLSTDSEPSVPSQPQGSTEMNLFKSLLYLGGLESIDSRIGEEEEAYGATYGNRIASAQAFGKRREARPAFHRNVVPVDRAAQARMPADACVAGGCG